MSDQLANSGTSLTSATAGSALDMPQSKESPARAIKADIEAYEREYKSWADRGDAIIDRYRDERPKLANEIILLRKFNILWSNVETLRPTLYARLPKAEVERRFKDKDPTGRNACEIAERMGNYLLQTGDANEVYKECVQDRLLPGRASAWVSYHADGKETDEQITDSDSGEPVTNDDGTPKMETSFQKTQETVRIEYVGWKDFGHSPVRTWSEVRRVWRKRYMSAVQLEKRFPEIWQDIPLDRKIKDQKDQTDNIVPQATIYEVYDKSDMKVYWVHVGMPEATCLLDNADPAVNVEGFWPCPKPFFATLTNGTLIPIADFVMYQDQANELDVVTNRISRLTDALKIVGAYDSSQPILERILQPNGTAENQLVPVDNWALLAEKGGVPNAISLVPIDMVMTVLQGLVQVREQIIQVIYQITGIADIIRGATNPNETATAQQIKGQFASLRIKDTQAEMAQFARSTLRIMIECAVQMFEPKTIWEMTQAENFCQPSPEDQQMQMAAMQQGLQPPQFPKSFMDALKLLRDDKLRSFHIDIETDSTIAMDESQDKQDAMEFLTTIGGFVNTAGQAIAQDPGLAPLMGEALLFVTRRFKAGRSFENTIEQYVDGMQKKLAQPQPPKPDPEMIKVQQQGENDNKRLQLDAATKQAEQQRDAQSDQADVALKAQDQHTQNRVAAATALSKVAPVAGASELAKIASGVH